MAALVLDQDGRQHSRRRPRGPRQVGGHVPRGRRRGRHRRTPYRERCRGRPGRGPNPPRPRVPDGDERGVRSRAAPYLDDHRLKGRPVVPLASVTDLVAWTFDAPDDGGLVIENLELIRGVMGGDIAEVDLSGRYDTSGLKTADAEVRVDGRVAYRAKLSAPRSPTPTVPTALSATR